MDRREHLRAGSATKVLVGRTLLLEEEAGEDAAVLHRARLQYDPGYDAPNRRMRRARRAAAGLK